MPTFCSLLLPHDYSNNFAGKINASLNQMLCHAVFEFLYVQLFNQAMYLAYIINEDGYVCFLLPQAISQSPSNCFTLPTTSTPIQRGKGREVADFCIECVSYVIINV